MIEQVLKKKLLVFMPTYEVNGAIQAWNASVDSFNDLEVPDGWEVKRVIGLDNPHPVPSILNVLHQYQQIQRRAIGEGYDALVTFEHDMIVPIDGLIKLLATPAPVVYGLYILKHGLRRVNAFKSELNIKESLSYIPDEYRTAEAQGRVEVSGVGMGFTLFRREILEQFDFRQSGNNYAPDWGIAQDCILHGIKQICRFDVKCGHIEDNGLVLHPDEREYRIVSKTKRKAVK